MRLQALARRARQPSGKVEVGGISFNPGTLEVNDRQGGVKLVGYHVTLLELLMRLSQSGELSATQPGALGH